ncbi:hypothetical protein M2451_001869 [Dysgonomonas sp. PFB1-18]|uniref:hypothetical protein n=1 Tax=unclassified Dysgonomonas TaxID=2630389 RepID=UPI00247497A3|nr:MULTISPECIES: hypothetical protein [unclassified Dysgonomonas]MDH6309504.1 hypothetical protein [Dysgonomonas sp. PF1-14]MDH6339168.1 hypothetical protein [Dysgonomonas sp. PF1-16]MDH6380545.1 hypothetical protein [Dysgonomonas sp. PFB1-18]MDH6398041.1 hypothetical protein [Dysgonomonas sp. PF1-23]
MKKIYYILLAMLAMGFAFTACSDEDPFSTATADDEPRILDPIFPDRENGNLPVIANISRDANLTMKLTVTPADHTTISWLIDGHEVQTGTELDINLKAGTYQFKVVVSTESGKSTYREGVVQVNPLSDDPWATEVGFERIIAPGTTARLYGNNLDKVKSIVIDGKTITDITYIESESGNYIEYTVPTDLTEGEHRVILVDTGGSEFGGNVVTVSKAALITSGADRTNANREWVMTGINLDQIASLAFAGQDITEFIRQTATEIAIICPSLADGEYKLTGKTTNGDNIQFYSAQGATTEKTVTVSSETVLWQGHHYVSWDLPDGNPNKTFNLIGKDVFATITAGAILKIHYSAASGDEYHQLRTTSGWWDDLPGTSVIEFSEDGMKEVQLTQEVLNKIQAEDGFLCVGHGYYVDMITVQ